MIAVSDTSPLNYLIQIDAADNLARLFESIAIPQAVVSELSHADAPASVREWIATPPSWLRMAEVSDDHPVSLAATNLHRGEVEAISAYQQLDADLLFLDEKQARSIAKSLGIQVIGTLGLLVLMARNGYVELPSLLDKLKATNFRVESGLYEKLVRASE